MKRERARKKILLLHHVKFFLVPSCIRNLLIYATLQSFHYPGEPPASESAFEIKIPRIQKSCLLHISYRSKKFIPRSKFHARRFHPWTHPKMSPKNCSWKNSVIFFDPLNIFAETTSPTSALFPYSDIFLNKCKQQWNDIFADWLHGERNYYRIIAFYRMIASNSMIFSLLLRSWFNGDIKIVSICFGRSDEGVETDM